MRIPAHSSSLLGLFNLQLGQQLDKPFKTLLVTVNPEEVNLETFLFIHSPIKII